MFRKSIGVVMIQLVVVTMLISSCIKDRCGDKICYNTGVCVDGVCACPVGYEGELCQDEWKTKFSGAWQARDEFVRDTSGAIQAYDIQITGNADSFMVSGLADTLETVVAKRESRYVFSFRSGFYVGNIADSVLFKGGKGTIEQDGSKVTGLFSLLKKDITTTHRFTWTR